MPSDNTRKYLAFEQVKEWASGLGFYDCGISKAGPMPKEEERVENWLSEGMHAGMSWMEKNKDKRYNPTVLVPGSKTVITVIYAYKSKEKLPEKDNFSISTYAYGEDYHKVVKDKLYLLLEKICKAYGKLNARVFVDSAPVLDRAWAHQSGLGFIGKNTMLINRKGGSYFFIGHLISDFEPTIPEVFPEKNFCGSCNLCIKACPTKALEPYRLDAGKCISYHTIENKGKIPETVSDNFKNWIFGCDICQDVCPWNRKVPAHSEPRFEPSAALKKMRKKDWKKLEQDQFDKLFEGSAVKRAGFHGLKRNIESVSE